MKQATHDLLAIIFSDLRPPRNITISQWADDYRYISAKSAALPGRWRTDKAPYQREIMDAISDPGVTKVVVKSAAQIGKTDAFILNAIGYYMQYDPSPIMVLQPTLPMAETFSKDRLAPMLSDTPVLKDKVEEKGRHSGNTILHKEFPGGHITMVGANSPAGLASRPIRVLFADEVDRYPPTAGEEGDPLSLAEKRTTTFWNKKIVCVSTPTIKGKSRIAKEYEESTMETWNVPCPECGELQPLDWAQVVFDKEDTREVGHTCAHCGVVSGEHAWKALFNQGKYVAEYPERAVRGFHLNSLASTFVSWTDIVNSFLKAVKDAREGDIQLLKTWTNTELGQEWEEPGETVDETKLLERREEYGCEVPLGVRVLTCAIDTQDDRFEIEVKGWGYGKESWGIQYHRIYGDLKQEQPWLDLDEFLLRSFQRADGTKLTIASTCFDMGGHYPDQVLYFTKARTNRRVFAIRGGNRADAPFIPRPTRNNAIKAPMFTLGVDVGKGLVLDRLKVEKPGPGYCHFPLEPEKGYDELYFKGLTSEHRVLKYRKGRPYYEWKLKHKRNEPFDLGVYNTAALEIYNPPLNQQEEAKPPRNHKRRGIRSKGVDV